MDKEITIIEISADAIYLVVIADKKSIDKLIKDLENNKINDTTFVPLKIDTPTASKCNELSQTLNKDIVIGSGVEIAQCYTYAEGHDNKNYILMELNRIENENRYELSFPKLCLNDDGDPEKTIFDWFKKNVKYIPKSIKKSLVPITLVGINDEILVFSAKYKNQ